MGCKLIVKKETGFDYSISQELNLETNCIFYMCEYLGEQFIGNSYAAAMNDYKKK